ncbi:MAG: tetratricopeptide repeat protein [Planctomycetes bacterium]|nr:tetratricopeptide repeat protein [Planctomycetota bacterium]
MRNIENLGLTERFANAVISYCTYIGKMFFPLRLGLFYPYTTSFPPAWQWIGALIILVVITILAIKFIKHPYFLVGWLWFLGTMVPVIGLVQVGQQAMADRYTYIPLIGLFIILVWGFADLTASWRYRKNVSIVATLIILGALTACTWRQVGFWCDSITLFEHSLSINDKNYLAHNHIGYDYAEKGEFDKAIEHHLLALEIKSNYTEALVNLGRELVSIQQYSKAIPWYQQALENNPNNIEALNGLGAALYADAVTDQTNDFTEAENACRKAIALNPNYSNAYYNLGQIYIKQNKIDLALEQYRQMIRINPYDTRAQQQIQQLQIRNPYP